MNTNEQHYLMLCWASSPYTYIDMQPQTLVRQKASQDATGRFGVQQPSNEAPRQQDNNALWETDVLQLFN